MIPAPARRVTGRGTQTQERIMWQPITEETDIPCACPVDCGRRHVTVGAIGYPDTQEIRVGKQLDYEPKETFVIIYLPPGVRLCREVEDAPAPERRTIVCLCGSTRFSEAYQRANIEETVAGRIVLTIGCDMRSDAELFAGKSVEELAALKDGLDALHLDKIAMADEVFILNVGGYIGDSTRRELAYARRLGKRVRFLEPEATALEATAAPGFNWRDGSEDETEEKCSVCDGKGRLDAVGERYEKCRNCNGYGYTWCPAPAPKRIDLPEDAYLSLDERVARILAAQEPEEEIDQ